MTGVRDVPSFWTPAETEATDPGGRRYRLRSWGWSSTSLQDAAAVAHDRLREIAARVARGEVRRGGYYPRTPLREERLGDVRDDAGDLAAVVTRNRYGADVLSTDQVLIADVDLPPGPRPGLLARLFGRSAAPPPDEAQERALSAVAAFAASHSDAGVHVYRTAAGLRVLVTGPIYAPDGDEAAAVLEQLATDRVYTTLCRVHGSYRARLTPKPWRIGMHARPLAWPQPDEHGRRTQQQWQQRYEARSAGYATCRLLSRTGPAPSAVQAHVLAVHDQVSRATEDLPLA